MTELLPEAEAARRRKAHPASSLLLISIICMIAFFIAWAGFAEIDSVTRGEGQVISSSKTQVIQNLEGGILASVEVHEGDTVKKGQTLLHLDSTIAFARYQQVRAEYLGLLGTIARLKAESTDTDPVFPDELHKEAPNIVENEKVLLYTRKKENLNNIEIVEGQAFQRKQAVAELKVKRDGLKKTSALLKKELGMNRPLLKSGAVSEVDILKMERLYEEKLNELQITKIAIPKSEAALKESLQKVEAIKFKFRTDALALLNEKRTRLASIRDTATAEKDRVRRTQIVSPMSGIVKTIHFTTKGAVIRPGDPIMEIVPAEDSLLIEAWILPQDVAFLRPGLNANVSITAYDPSIYGTLDAVLENISADTFTNDRGISLYRVNLRAGTNRFGKKGKNLPIIPGMTASADILTGKRTILYYLLKPIHRMQNRALREM